MKRIPIIPTIIVIIAIAAMIRLGFWQLDRLHEKEVLLARYAVAEKLPPMAFPSIPVGDQLLFRRATGFCLKPVGQRIESGRNQNGVSGWRHIISCRTGAEGPGLTVDIGWSQSFNVKNNWAGGTVSGMISAQPDHRSLISKLLRRGVASPLMLIADVGAPGLLPSAKPILTDIPNNHLAYAGQWFLFAVFAALIYGLALRRRLS